jgi:hypothetical protein
LINDGFILTSHQAITERQSSAPRSCLSDSPVVITRHAGGAMNATQVQGPDGSDSFLKLVEFKWLMAGMGWWVDLTRLQRDGTYGNECLRRAMSSGSQPLQAHGAALLATQVERVSACH